MVFYSINIKLLFVAVILCILSSCDKPEKEAVITWQNGDNVWSSNQANITLYDGFLAIYAESKNKFGVLNQLNLRINGTVPGTYSMNNDMFGSVAFMESKYYSYNAYLPDTSAKGQFFNCIDLELKHRQLSAEFEFSVTNSATGKPEIVKGNIKGASFHVNQNIKNSIIEISNDRIFFGLLDKYDGFHFNYIGLDPFTSRSFSFHTSINPGVYNIKELPVFWHSFYTPGLGDKSSIFSGNIHILEKQSATTYIKGIYDTELVFNKMYRWYWKGFFTASR